MSKYAFAVKNSRDLLAKAKADADRYFSLSNDRLTWTYALIDYIQTAWHIADWVAEETGRSKTEIRDEIDSLCSGSYWLLGELAIGQKHWTNSNRNRAPNVGKTTAPPPRYTSFRRESLGIHEAPFIIDKTGNKLLARLLIESTLDALEQFLAKNGP